MPRGGTERERVGEGGEAGCEGGRREGGREGAKPDFSRPPSWIERSSPPVGGPDHVIPFRFPNRPSARKAQIENFYSAL